MLATQTWGPESAWCNSLEELGEKRGSLPAKPVGELCGQWKVLSRKKLRLRKVCDVEF